MTSLLDIADASTVVKVRGVDVTVYGVAMQDVAALMRRYPEIYGLFSGDDKGGKAADLLSGPAIPAVIAAGLRNKDSEEVEAKIRGLYMEEQIDLLKAILKMTMPSGVVPFMEKLTELGKLLSADTGESATVSAPKSPKPSKA